MSFFISVLHRVNFSVYSRAVFFTPPPSAPGLTSSSLQRLGQGCKGRLVTPGALLGKTSPTHQTWPCGWGGRVSPVQRL